MAEIIDWPMSFASFEKEERKITLVWANSSNRIVTSVGAPDTWVNTDAELACTRLLSASWNRVAEGKVTR
jgi:hypothetical protein